MRSFCPPQATSASSPKPPKNRFCFFKPVIPVLARRSASARRRENGNPDAVPAKAGNHMIKPWIPAGVCPALRYGAGMTIMKCSVAILGDEIT